MDKACRAGLLLVVCVLAAAPVWAASPNEPPGGQASAPPPLTPEQKMARRFPQDVRVSDLIGRSVVDGRDHTVGALQSVVRSPDGHLKLLVPYGGVLGFGQKLVAVPIEAVVSLGTEIFAVDLTAEDWTQLPLWTGTPDLVLPRDAALKIAIDRH